MYDVQKIALRIKEEARKQKIPLKDLLKQCDLGINAINELSKGKVMSCISLAKIADVLNVSTDYLLGRDQFTK